MKAQLESHAPSSAIAAPTGESMVLQILKVADLLTRIGDAKVFGKELTQAQFNVLMVLKRHDDVGVSQKDILANLVSTKGNVSIHITNLTRMGYIRKRTSREDARMHVLRLTAKGYRVLAELEPRYERHLQAITGDLSPKPLAVSMALLDEFQARCRATLAETRGET
jgi:DNA-binding MarR family transcriptional regulator